MRKRLSVPFSAEPLGRRQPPQSGLPMIRSPAASMSVSGPAPGGKGTLGRSAARARSAACDSCEGGGYGLRLREGSAGFRVAVEVV